MDDSLYVFQDPGQVPGFFVFSLCRSG